MSKSKKLAVAVVGISIFLLAVGVLCWKLYRCTTAPCIHARTLEFRTPLNGEHIVVLPDLQPGDLVHVAIAAQQGQVRPALLDAQDSALSPRAGWFRIRQAGVHTLVFTGEEAVFHAEIECKRQQRDAAADCPAP